MNILRRGRGERGASLIEFAIVAPLLFLLLFGVIECARMIYSYSTIWNGAREGARYATTVGDNDTDGAPNYLDCAGIEEAALSRVAAVDLTADDLTIKYYRPDGSEVADCSTHATSLADGTTPIDSGYTIEVRAEGEFDAIVPLLSSFLEGIDMSSTQRRSIFKGVVGAG